MSRLGKAALVLVGALVVAQLVRPETTNPPEERGQTLADQRPLDAPVSALLDRSCVDCHSNRTTWPWYSRVAPVSWLVAHDVSEGRGELNLSEWGRYPPDRQRKLLGELCEDVREGEMPPAAYLLLHPEARVKPEQARALCDWVRAALGASP